MYKSYKTEINPTEEQRKKIELYFKVCVAAYNNYLQYNLEMLDQKKFLISPAKYIQLMKAGKIDDAWLKFFSHKYYEHAVIYIMKNAEKVLIRYQAHKDGRPSLKKLGTKNISIHFTASSIHKPQLPCERHRIFIPFLGWIRLKEKGYIPFDSSKEIISGWIKKSAGRYYVSALVKEEETIIYHTHYNEGLGIDLNVNNFAYLSDGTVFENINKSKHVKHLEEKLSRENRKLSRKLNAYLQLNDEDKSSCERKNYLKQLHEVDVVYERLSMIRKDYVKKCVGKIIDKKPAFVALEDLNVTEMVADTRFSRYITNELFYQFKMQLYHKCRQNGIEFRVINKWIPTSKTCHECGYVIKSIGPAERDFICPSCGVINNRDYNASLNIRDARDYVVWTS